MKLNIAAVIMLVAGVLIIGFASMHLVEQKKEREHQRQLWEANRQEQLRLERARFLNNDVLQQSAQTLHKIADNIRSLEQDATRKMAEIARQQEREDLARQMVSERLKAIEKEKERQAMQDEHYKSLGFSDADIKSGR